MKEQLLSDIIETLTDLDDAKRLLDEILTHYDVYRQQFTAIDTMKFAPRGDLSIPKSNWKSESEILNQKIKKYLQFDDSE